MVEFYTYNNPIQSVTLFFIGKILVKEKKRWLIWIELIGMWATISFPFINFVWKRNEKYAYLCTLQLIFWRKNYIYIYIYIAYSFCFFDSCFLLLRLWLLQFLYLNWIITIIKIYSCLYIRKSLFFCLWNCFMGTSIISFLLFLCSFFYIAFPFFSLIFLIIQ